MRKQWWKLQHIGNFIWFHLLPFAWYHYNSIHLLSNVVKIHVLLFYWHVSCVYSHMYTSTVHTNSYNRLHSLRFLVFKLKTMTIQTFTPHIRFEKEEITMWGRGHFLKKKKNTFFRFNRGWVGDKLGKAVFQDLLFSFQKPKLKESFEKKKEA